MSQTLRTPAILAFSVAILASTGCDDRLGLELKGVGDTANQDSGVGPGDTGGPGGSDGTTGNGDTGDTVDSGGSSTSPNVNQNMEFEAESWRDIMWRTRKSRRSGF